MIWDEGEGRREKKRKDINFFFFRAVIQLTVLGLILGPIFRYNVAAFVLLYIFGMSMIASVVHFFFSR